MVNATACAVALARMNRRRGTRAQNTATGYSASMTMIAKAESNTAYMKLEISTDGGPFVVQMEGKATKK